MSLKSTLEKPLLTLKPGTTQFVKVRKRGLPSRYKNTKADNVYTIIKPNSIHFFYDHFLTLKKVLLDGKGSF